MDQSLREVVRRRAENACEYCRIAQEATPLIAFHIEHIVSRQHGGSDDPAGLALACDRCNAYKGPNITSRAYTNVLDASRKVAVSQPTFSSLQSVHSHLWLADDAALYWARPVGCANQVFFRPREKEQLPNRPAPLA